MTERELIVAASREAANGTPDEASISLLLEDYRRRRDNLFADKDWLFLLQYYETSQLTKVTTDDRNILMPYKYRFPANASVQEVVSVNINLYTGIESLSVDDSLRIGYSSFPENGFPTDSQPNFTFIDGILYSDKEVENVIVKNKVVERELDSETKHLLVLEFAIFIASNIKQDIEKARELKAEKKQQYTKAAYRNIENPRDPYSNLLRSWYKKFFRGLNY